MDFTGNFSHENPRKDKKNKGNNGSFDGDFFCCFLPAETSVLLLRQEAKLRVTQSIIKTLQDTRLPSSRVLKTQKSLCRYE